MVFYVNVIPSWMDHHAERCNCRETQQKSFFEELSEDMKNVRGWNHPQFYGYRSGPTTSRAIFPHPTCYNSWRRTRKQDQDNLPRSTEENSRPSDTLNKGQSEQENERAKSVEQQTMNTPQQQQKGGAGVDCCRPSFQQQIFEGLSNIFTRDRTHRVEGEEEEEDKVLRFNMAGCDPNSITVKHEANLLRVKGNKETKNGFMRVEYGRTLPEGVSSEALCGSLSPDGILTIKDNRHLSLPITVEAATASEEKEDQTDKPEE